MASAGKKEGDERQISERFALSFEDYKALRLNKVQEEATVLYVIQSLEITWHLHNC